MKHIKLITRKSALAVRQAEEVLAHFHGLEYTITTCESYGDKHKDISLMSDVPGDFFTREIDGLIVKGKGDIAVHSAKDIPVPLAEGLALAALVKGGDPSDSLVSKNSYTLKTLPAGSKVGTSSVSRKTQLLAQRPDLVVISIRGTIEERITLIDRGVIDALIVATCALKRLGFDLKTSVVLPFSTHPLQGMLAVVVKNTRADMKVLFSKIDDRLNYGKVYLVGAGTGSRESLTLKAERVLKSADTIFYDDLIDTGMLDFYNAKKVYVGKRKGKHHLPQEDINKVLYEAATKRQVVVRLKGGDPFIYGRGGEEMVFLRERHIDVEVIPGISAAQEAAASSQVPLTMRGVSGKLSFVSAHNAENTLSPGETQVFYMGASRLKEIGAVLVAEGADPELPVAIIRNAGFYDAEIKHTIVRNLPKEKVRSPLIVIAGKTAKPSTERPIILYTGTDYLRCFLPGRFVHYPLINIKPIEFHIEPSHYDSIVFTSKNAVRVFCSRYRISKKQKIISIGPSTSRELKSYGYKAVITAEIHDSDFLAEEIKKLKLKSILYPCSLISKNVLKNLSGLEKKVVYNTVSMKQPEIDLHKSSGIFFTSPSTVKAFFRIYSKIPKHLVLYVYGKHTSGALKKWGYTNNVQTVSL